MPTTTMNPNIPTISPPSKITGSNEKKAPKPTIINKSYAQASKANILSSIEDVIWVKEVFPTLSADEVGKILKAKNSSGGTKKPKINMTTRGQSRREVIIPMTKTNAELIINSAHIHISLTSTNVWKIPNQTFLQISFDLMSMESSLQQTNLLVISIYQQLRNTWKTFKILIQIPLRVLVSPSLNHIWRSLDFYTRVN